MCAEKARVIPEATLHCTFCRGLETTSSSSPVACARALAFDYSGVNGMLYWLRGVSPSDSAFSFYEDQTCRQVVPRPGEDAIAGDAV